MKQLVCENLCFDQLKCDVSRSVGREADFSRAIKYSWGCIFYADWSMRITAGHINGEKQLLQQTADE